MFRCVKRFLLQDIGVGIVYNLTIAKPYNTIGVLLGQFWIVCDHDDQPILGDLFQKIHHLDAGIRVQGARRFIRQKNIWIIDQGAGNGHALHLSTGHLVGFFMQLLTQTHLFQRGDGPFTAFRSGDAGNGQRQLYIGQHGLMRDQVITLKHKSNRMIAVGVPVPVFILLGRDLIDQITAVITIQSADDIEQRCLTGTTGAQDGYKLIIPQVQADIVQSFLHQITGHILLTYIFDLQHANKLLPFC